MKKLLFVILFILFNILLFSQVPNYWKDKKRQEQFEQNQKRKEYKRDSLIKSLIFIKSDTLKTSIKDIKQIGQSKPLFNVEYYKDDSCIGISDFDGEKSTKIMIKLLNIELFLNNINKYYDDYLYLSNIADSINAPELEKTLGFYELNGFIRYGNTECVYLPYTKEIDEEIGVSIIRSKYSKKELDFNCIQKYKEWILCKEYKNNKGIYIDTTNKPLVEFNYRREKGNYKNKVINNFIIAIYDTKVKRHLLFSMTLKYEFNIIDLEYDYNDFINKNKSKWDSFDESKKDQWIKKYNCDSPYNMTINQYEEYYINMLKTYNENNIYVKKIINNKVKYFIFDKDFNKNIKDNIPYFYNILNEDYIKNTPNKILFEYQKLNIFNNLIQ